MNILLKSITIIQPGHRFHSKKKDILIEKGKIQKIASSIDTEVSKTIDGRGLYVMPGMMDLSVSFCDPGMEYKEQIESGLECALDGGFSAVCINPNTTPAIDTKADIEYVLGRSKGHMVRSYPIGSVSKNRTGEELAELLDMHKSGAIAFSDDLRAIKNPALLKLALLYSKDFGAKIFSFPFNEELAHHGVMNEGVTSTMNGLKGIPNISEEIQIVRDLYIAEYCNSPIHFTRISTKESVDLIRKAKKKGIEVTCDVALANLIFEDSDLESFDTNLKLMPPLRTSKDRKALLKGLLDRTIDAVVSDHRPEDPENKVLEFDHARFGMIGLQTYVSLALSVMDMDMLYQVAVKGPRDVLGIDVPDIEEDSVANLCIIDPELNWTFDAQSNKSLSRNSSLFGQEIKGKSVGLIVGKKAKI